MTDYRTGDPGAPVTHIREQYNVSGVHNIGKQVNHAAIDAEAALRELVQAVETLRGDVSAEDRRTIDEALITVRRGEDAASPGGVRRALSTLAGVATVVGQVGAPVIEAVRKLMAALAL
jgi:hypothetical protein